MSCQCGSSCKRLGAAWVGADIGSLARMHTAVPGQGRRVAECLVTDVALVGLLASVHPHVHGKR